MGKNFKKINKILGLNHFKKRFRGEENWVPKKVVPTVLNPGNLKPP